MTLFVSRRFVVTYRNEASDDDDDNYYDAFMQTSAMRNETVRNILEQEETIIDKIQKRILTWFCHVERMEDIDFHTGHSTATLKA